MQKLIVFDTDNLPYQGNRVFDRAIASKYPGALAIHKLYELATSLGYVVMTGDVFLSEKPEGKAYVISEEFTSQTQLILDTGALFVAVFCMETPSFAWRFYRDLHKRSLLYKHAFLFSGASKWVDLQRVKFHPTVFPQPSNSVGRLWYNDWDNRSFLVMINSNIVRYVKPSQLLASLTKPELRGELYTEKESYSLFFKKKADSSVWKRLVHKKAF